MGTSANKRVTWLAFLLNVLAVASFALLGQRAPAGSPGVVMLDWLQNGLHLIPLRNSGPLSATLVLIASLATAAKWWLVAVTILGLFYCLLAPAAYDWVRRMRN